MRRERPELLIPASSLEVLKTAVIFGADAYNNCEITTLFHRFMLVSQFKCERKNPMKSTKAFIATALALVMLVSLTACTSRNDNTSSSSVAPSSAPAASSMAPSSSEPDDLLSDIEDGVSDVASNIESAVTTTMSTSAPFRWRTPSGSRKSAPRWKSG